MLSYNSTLQLARHKTFPAAGSPPKDVYLLWGSKIVSAESETTDYKSTGDVCEIKGRIFHSNLNYVQFRLQIASEERNEQRTKEMLICFKL